MPAQTETRIYTILFLLVAAFGIGTLALRVLQPFLAAIAWAVAFAVVFNRPWMALERWMPKRRNLAAGLMCVAIVLIVLLPAGVMARLVAMQTVNLAGRVTTFLQTNRISSFSDLAALPRVTGALDRLNRLAGISPDDFQAMVTGVASRASVLLASASRLLVYGVLDATVTFVMTIFLLFFLFRDGREIGAAALELLPLQPAGRQELRRSLGRMIGAVFRGSMVCSLVQGTSGGIGWWIAGLGSPTLAGAAMAVLSLLPIGGAAIVWAPGAVWLWLAGHHGSGVFLFVWGTLVTSFAADNILKPILIGRSEELSTLVVFVGVFGGLAAFGLLGLFIGPVTLTLAVTLIQILRRQANPASG